MSIRLRLARTLSILALSGLTLSAWAGQSCEDRPPTPRHVYESLQLAQSTYDALDASGAQVAIVARRGQDLSRYGLTYSHLAFVWRDHPEGRWTAVNLLNACGTDHGDLFNSGLGDFFMEGIVMQALVIVPSPEIQEHVAQVLREGRARQLFTAQYNMVAYPYSSIDENSNQWALELLALAMAPKNYPVMTREDAQVWIQAQGFVPTTLHISALERLGADLTRANLSFNGQPFDRRMNGLIDTATVESIVAFLKHYDPAMQQKVLVLGGSEIGYGRGGPRRE